MFGSGSKIFVRGGGEAGNNFMSSASLYGDLGVAVPPVGFRGKAPGGVLRGEISRKLTHIFTTKSQDFNEMKLMSYN